MKTYLKKILEYNLGIIFKPKVTLEKIIQDKPSMIFCLLNLFLAITLNTLFILTFMVFDEMIKNNYYGGISIFYRSYEGAVVWSFFIFIFWLITMYLCCFFLILTLPKYFNLLKLKETFNFLSCISIPLMIDWSILSYVFIDIFSSLYKQHIFNVIVMCIGLLWGGTIFFLISKIIFNSIIKVVAATLMYVFMLYYIDFIYALLFFSLLSAYKLSF